jgi:hypothetical protein
MKSKLQWTVMVLAVGWAGSAIAGNVVFLPATGNWNIPANWSGGIVPDASQSTIVYNGSIVTVNSDVGTCGSAFIGQGTPPTRKGTGQFRPGAVLTVANLFLGRDWGNYGQFNQSGGTLTVNGSVSVGDSAGGGTGASGELNLTGGSLQMAGGGSSVQVGNQGVGRMLVAGSAVLSTPSLLVGNTADSSGSQLYQWGGTIYAGSFTVGSAGASNCGFTISSGATVWGGTLLVNGTLTAQGSQFWLQGTNSAGLGLQLADTGTLRLELGARGLTPIQITGSQISIAPGSKLVVDGTRYLRWGGGPGTFKLVRHGGYAWQAQFAATNVTLSGFGELTAALNYTSNSLDLVLSAPTNGVAHPGRGMFCEYWEVPIKVNPAVSGRTIAAPLSALPDFTNTMVVTHPIYGLVVTNINLTPRRRDTNYFLRFTGYLNVPTNGSYTFYLNSDDGSKLWLDGNLLVNNDGPQGATEVSGTTNLTAGMHALVVGYFQATGGQTLNVSWAGPALAKQTLTDAALFLASVLDSQVRQAFYQNLVQDSEMAYNYAPSFMYDETEGLYKIWMCGSGDAPGAVGGDNVVYREATSLTGLLTAPLTVALKPSLDPTKFDQIHACDPNVYRVGNLYYLTYSGNTDNTQLPERTRIGMAVSYDGGRTFQRLHGGVHNIEPNTNTYVDGYGTGQSAVVQANDGYFYMIYTDADSGPITERVVRSLDPAFTPGSFTNVANLFGVGNSVDLAYDATNSQFIIVAQLEMIYFDSNWNQLRRVSRGNPFAWTMGEDYGLLSDSQKRPVNYNQEGVASYVLAASTVDDVGDTTLWANWVAGDLKYLVLPQTLTPGWAVPQVISEGYSFAGNSGSVIGGTVLNHTNNFTVDFWARPDADASLPAEAISGSPGTGGQRYVTHPEQGGAGAAWGAGHAGMGVSLGRNGIGVFEHAGGYLPSLLTWSSEITDWVHVAVVYTDKTPWLYVNGKFVRSGLTSPQTFVHPTANNFGGSVYGYFSGRVWNYRVWNRPLTAAEVALLPGATAGTNFPSALVGKWLQDPTLDQGSANGTKALDATVAGAVAGNSYSYQLADNGGGRFTINSSTGLVTVLNKTLLNFATNTVQPFTVRAVDNILNTFDRPFNVTVTATNNRPSITSMPNYVRMAGATLTVATPASDPDVPPQPFTFTLLTAPTGATVNASSGLISWHPLIGLGGATSNYTFRVKVDDNGAPNLSATQTFAVTVFQPTQPPTVDGISTSGGQFALLVSGEAGPDYTLAASTNLVQWTPLFITNPAALPVWLADPATTTNARRFYRVIMGP